MEKLFKFEIGQLVSINGVRALITFREIDEDTDRPDYLCRPVSPQDKLPNLGNAGDLGWYFESDLKGIL